VQHGIAQLVADHQPAGLRAVAVNPNDASRYPDDAPDRMVEVARQAGYPFPYLVDESQAVARAYGAACTPDFFLYDERLRLVYRGQMDGSRPSNDVANDGTYLRRAIEALIAHRPALPDQRPSLGCGIKWKPGNEPEYAP
jgi:hypothetical protein